MNRRLALAVSLGLALWVLWPAWLHPGEVLAGNPQHPDCLGNHWLLAWVAEQLSHGGSLLHNDRYYWPIGDAPLLAGNGTEGFLYLPFHLALGWPAGVPSYLLALLTLNGMGGYALARAAGADPRAALIAILPFAAGPYPLQELSSGRFTQADLVWLLFFLAAWLRLLAAPSYRRAIVAGLLLAATSFFYWYYGLFAVLAGGILLAFQARRALLRPLLVFVATGSLAIAPWALLFAAHWAEIPGATELFPHPQALAESVAPGLPLWVDGTRSLGRVMPAGLWLLGLAGGVLAFQRRDRPMLALAATWLVFTLLSWGPAFPGAPYTLLYGLTAPLRRFWWPGRHVVVAHAAWVSLGALALSAWMTRWPRARLALPAAILLTTLPVQALQGARARVVTVPMEEPQLYPKLAKLPGEVLIQPPLSPEASTSQEPLILQRWHEKTLLTGHAMWVARVRPPEWEAFMAHNPLLSALQAWERGEGPATLPLDPTGLQALLDGGARWWVLDRSLFSPTISKLADGYRALLQDLFGAPVDAEEGIWLFDATQARPQSEVALPPWRWPPGLDPAGPERPLAGRPPVSKLFPPDQIAQTRSAPPLPADRAPR